MNKKLLTSWVESPIHVLKVFSEDAGNKKLLGTLHCDTCKGSTAFQWSSEALERGEQWSPLRMPLGEGLRSFSDTPVDFNGLPGLLNDALPDGWGLRLMDQHFHHMQLPVHYITPAFRLAFLGNRIWGSLSFEADEQSVEISDALDLTHLSGEVEQFVKGGGEVSEQLLIAGGSLHGARPKIMVDLDSNDQARLSLGKVEDGFEPWIVKFAAPDEHPDAPIGEQVYMTLAKKMGVKVCDSRILILNGKPAFATKRFDRRDGSKIFSHSLSGLLHVSHRQCNLDYTNIGQILEHLNASDQLEQAFRRACFNAALSVRDDHAKNISFIKNNNTWSLSPAYDLTYMNGPGGYHSMNYADCPERDPTQKFVLQVGNNYGLEPSLCNQILHESLEISHQFAAAANEHDMPHKWIKPIEQRLKQLSKKLRPLTVAAPKRSV